MTLSDLARDSTLHPGPLSGLIQRSRGLISAGVDLNPRVEVERSTPILEIDVQPPASRWLRPSHGLIELAAVAGDAAHIRHSALVEDENHERLARDTVPL